MYKIIVITPEKIVMEEEIYSLIAPGGLGYLQILTNHCSLLTNLVPGKLTIERNPGEKLEYAISGGFLEVLHNEATILADAIETPEEIDLARAEASLRKAEERLKEPADHIDVMRAKNAKDRALNRIKISKEYHYSIQTYHSPRNIEV
jgi:F-type H+-transporting ATPase subunit epsilon